MDAAAFRSAANVPDGASAPLAALWHVAQGDWKKAHDLVNDLEGETAAWVHAHLHRVEGDLDNAGYWYGQAKKPAAKNSTDEEWKQIADALLLEGGW
ncbi:MAG TPA: hypothetical protein VHA70_08815 [Bauldia sp.]|nr:hypothetical protein [Bauldia sp.]